MYEKTAIPEEMQNKIFKKFTKLPLRHKLVVYAKLAHGNSFKPQNNDLFGLNRRLVSSIFRSFVSSLKDEFNVKENIGKKDKSRASKSSTNKEKRNRRNGRGRKTKD